MLTFSSRNLSEDCGRVVPGNEVNVPAMDAATALARLQALAGVPAVALVDSDARIYLAIAGIKLAVQNENGRLYTQRVPESAHAAIQQTPEEIVRLLTGEPGAELKPPPVAEPEGLVTRPRSLRERLSSPWAVAVLAVVAVGVAGFSFSAEVPPGIKMISDPARVARLNAEFSGRYGETELAGQTLLLVELGRFAVYAVGESGAPAGLLMDTTYRFGQRGEQIVLVVANGAVLEPGRDGSLSFNDAVYPRLAAPR